jgi:hypothetical protein
MCLTCGCMDAHKVMGDNVTYEDLKRISDGNGKTVEQTLDTVSRTAAIDRGKHPAEYPNDQAPSEAASPESGVR